MNIGIFGSGNMGAGMGKAWATNPVQAPLPIEIFFGPAVHKKEPYDCALTKTAAKCR